MSGMKTIPAAELLDDCLTRLPRGGTVVDYGCYNWSVAARSACLGRSDLIQIGLDLNEEPPGRPTSARFELLPAPGASLPLADADLLVASHVLEHCLDAVGVFGTLIAAVKPGGLIYLEAPSEETAMLSSDPDVEGHAFTSFWDDPTHVRPWTPAAFYRLGLSFGARPESCQHATRGGIHCSLAVIRRIDPEPPRYRYVSLANVSRGIEAALAHVGRSPS
jgi:SAM-dependent methyltransferase